MVTMMKGAMQGEGVAAADACANAILAIKAPPTTETGLVTLIDAAKTARLGRLDLEKRRDKITDPLNDALKAVRAEANPQIDKLKRAEEWAKGLKSQYDQAQERKRQQVLVEHRRLEQQAAAVATLPGEEAPPPLASIEAPPPPNKAAGGIGAMHGRKVPRVRVKNRELAFSVHPELFELNEAAAMRVLKDAAPNPVPGLELYYETTQVLS
jgi:hypothetical protein